MLVFGYRYLPLFGASATILSVGKICIYASQNYTLLMFNGTYVLKMSKNYMYDVTQYVTKYVITDRFA